MVANFIDGIIAQFDNKPKNAVCATISVGGHIEVAKVDAANNKVIKYGSRPLGYNDSSKEIKDYVAFKDNLLDLFEELGIPAKSNLYLSIPAVHVGKAEFPALLDNEGVGEALISEAEQNYIFRRNEPVISWYDITEDPNAESRTILYSALQRQALDNIQTVLGDAGVNVIGIEPAIISTMRALKHLGKITNKVENNSLWALMKITDTGYSLSTMHGQNIVEYYNEPLALKTYEGEEIYETIYASLQIALMNTQANNLFIISETDLVSAENMSTRVPIDGEVTFLENNRFRHQQFIDVDADIPAESVEKMSLESVGTALHGIADYPVNLDYMQGGGEPEAFVFTFGGNEYSVTETILKRYIVMAVLFLVLPALILFGIFGLTDMNKQKQLSSVQAEVKELTGEIDKLKKIEMGDKGKFDENAEIEKVLNSNKTKVKAYSALGESVPKNLWITSFVAKNDGKIDITGESESVEDIYVFYSNMKDYLLDKKLKLRKLNMESASVEDALASSSNYSFEITNMTEEELNPPVEGDKETADAKDAKKGGSRAKNGGAANSAKNTGVNPKSGGAAGGAKQRSSRPANGKNVKDLEEVEVH